MRLHVGERLNSPETRDQGGYLVTGVVRETAWFGLYTARKAFANFDFSQNLCRQADEQEWLEVLLRTLRYPHPEDEQDAALRRRLLRQEVEHVLARRPSALWPQPVDLLEMPGAQASASAAAEPDPVLVLARPTGLPLPEWLQTKPALAERLSVLAELLVFLAGVHEQGWVLQGLGPASILVDRAGRVHFLGTDLVVPASPAGPALLDRSRLAPAAWLRLFPAERFPRGYGAPELFQEGAVSDARTDLYSWACVALQLLGGWEPWKIAWEQGKPWALFGPVHFERLEQALAEAPRGLVESWGRRLGVEGDLVRAWPSGLVQGLAAALQADPGRRPASVAQLRQWLADPPPAAPAAVLPLMIGQGQARLYLDLAGVDPHSELEVRRQVRQPCLTPTSGTCLASGPPRPIIEDPEMPLTPDPVFYSAFTRRPGSARWSPAAWGELLQPLPSVLLQEAEAEAKRAPQADMPARIALFFAALDAVRMAQALAGSKLPTVRRWGLERLGQSRGDPARSDPGRVGAAESILWQSLEDAEPGLRLLAARLLLQRPQTDDALLALARTLGRHAGAEPLDQLARLRPHISEEQWRRLEARLESERPAQCPECGIVVPGPLRDEHLRREHGYVSVDGRLVPPDVALSWWWDELFLRGQKAAHGQIVQQCGQTGMSAAQDGGLEKYVKSLGDALERHPQVLRELDREAGDSATSVAGPNWRDVLLGWERLPEALPALLGSGRPWVRALGRQLAVARLAQLFAGRPATSRQLQEELRRLCPGPSLVEESIYLCGRLTDLGVDPDTTSHLLADLRDERLLACPECAARVRAGDLETHLRRAHQILQFRGRRGEFDEMCRLIVDALCQGNPDPRAWQALLGLAQDKYRKNVGRRLLSWICKRLARWPRPQRQQAAAGVAETLAQSPEGPRFLPLLAGGLGEEGLERLTGGLALELVARLPGPLAEELLDVVLPLLGRRELSREGRQGAAAALLRAHPSDATAARILQAYIAHSGKLRAVAKLDELEKATGRYPPVEELRERLSDQVRLSCPRCPTQLERKDMVEHLWQRHRLVLDGWKVREPWRLIEDWLVDYVLEKDPALLERCKALAGRLDPEGGQFQLQRLMARRVLGDHNTEEALRREARRRHASLCPHCFALAPVPAWPAFPELAHTPSLLEGAGYRLEAWAGSFFPALEIETPQGQLYRGRQPERGLTRGGAWVLLVLPAALAAFLASHLLVSDVLRGFVPFALAGGLGMLLTGLLFFFSAPAAGEDRLVDLAWEHLVPHLLVQGEDTADRGDESGIRNAPAAREFVAGLIHCSYQRGDPAAREDILQACCQAAAEVAGRDASALVLLAACWGLVIRDAHEQGGDGLAILVEQVERALRGSVPLAYAQLLIGEMARAWPELSQPGALRQRWQELLWLRARALGLEGADMVEIARAAPALQAALNISVEGARRLRLGASEAARKIRRRNAQACPECGKLMLLCMGEVGVLVEGERGTVLAGR